MPDGAPLCVLCGDEGFVEVAAPFFGPLGFDPQNVHVEPCPDCNPEDEPEPEPPSDRDTGDECHCKDCGP